MGVAGGEGYLLLAEAASKDWLFEESVRRRAVAELCELASHGEAISMRALKKLYLGTDAGTHRLILDHLQNFSRAEMSGFLDWMEKDPFLTEEERARIAKLRERAKG
jgi:hypothetical protein